MTKFVHAIRKSENKSLRGLLDREYAWDILGVFCLVLLITPFLWGIAGFIAKSLQESDIRDIKTNITHMQSVGDTPSCSYSMEIEDPLYRYYYSEVFCHGKDVDSLPNYITDKEAEDLYNQ